LIELCKTLRSFHVVKLRYSLAHIYYIIHHHSLKLLKILSLTIPSVAILSLSKKIQCRRGMGYAKICEKIKRGKCPEPQKRKRKKVRREVKIDKCPE